MCKDISTNGDFVFNSLPVHHLQTLNFMFNLAVIQVSEP
jgi:hypothetical protein